MDSKVPIYVRTGACQVGYGKPCELYHICYRLLMDDNNTYSLGDGPSIKCYFMMFPVIYLQIFNSTIA